MGRNKNKQHGKNNGKPRVVVDVFSCLFGAGFGCPAEERDRSSDDGQSVPGARRAVTEAIEEKAGSSTRHCDVQGQLNDSDSTGCRGEGVGSSRFQEEENGGRRRARRTIRIARQCDAACGCWDGKEKGRDGRDPGGT